MGYIYSKIKYFFTNLSWSNFEAFDGNQREAGLELLVFGSRVRIGYG